MRKSALYVAAGYGRTGVTRLLLERGAKWDIPRPVKDRSASMLKDITHIFHDNPERLLDLDVPDMPKSVIYGFVEKNNDRSRNFAEIGGFSKTGRRSSAMALGMYETNTSPESHHD